MSGFIIKCKDCGNEVSTYEDYTNEGKGISIDVNVNMHGTSKEYYDTFLWCEVCDNTAEFK